MYEVWPEMGRHEPPRAHTFKFGKMTPQGSKYFLKYDVDLRGEGEGANKSNKSKSQSDGKPNGI